MKRTKFKNKFEAYDFQTLDQALDEEVKAAIYHWWIDLLREISKTDMDLARRLLNDLPFPEPNVPKHFRRPTFTEEKKDEFTRSSWEDDEEFNLNK